MMRLRMIRRWLVLVAVIGPCAYLSAGAPMPSVCYYGMVRDAYGYPYTKDTEVVLQSDGVEHVRYQIAGELTPGVNFRMELEMDSGGTSYEHYAAHVDDVLDLVVYYQGQVVMSNELVTVPAAGSTVRLDLQTGTDSDGDGLPDIWEELMIMQSDGALLTLQDVRPEDDFDGDGSSNLHEFQSGTFPYLSYDSFALENLPRTQTGRFSFRFMAVDGFTYQVRGAAELKGLAWGDIPFAYAETADLASGYIFGDDTFKTVYIEETNNTVFVQLRIK